MELVIRNTANQPIYEQIYSQIRAQIIAGTLQPGDALPSIRALAKDLRISVITTQRAYDELEADGFLYTVAGKGCFVAGEALLSVRAEKEGKIEAFRQLTEELMLAGFGKEQLLRTVEEVWRSRPESGEEEKHD